VELYSTVRADVGQEQNECHHKGGKLVTCICKIVSIFIVSVPS
jgi:hypothetical protein